MDALIHYSQLSLVWMMAGCLAQGTRQCVVIQNINGVTSAVHSVFVSLFRTKWVLDILRNCHSIQLIHKFHFYSFISNEFLFSNFHIINSDRSWYFLLCVKTRKYEIRFGSKHWRLTIKKNRFSCVCPALSDWFNWFLHDAWIKLIGVHFYLFVLLFQYSDTDHL